jgi:hypothetical protein
MNKLKPNMAETTTESEQLNWRPASYAALIAFIIDIPILIRYPTDISLILLFVVGSFLVLVTAPLLIIAAFRRKRRQFLLILSMATVYWVISAALVIYDLKNPTAIRTAARWLASSRDYKEKVLSQSVPSGELKHIEWDGWGWAGMDTTMYLVFDPTDSLSEAASSHQSGKFNGIPCQVQRVRRLESSWYTVLLYTNEFWDRCN